MKLLLLSFMPAVIVAASVWIDTDPSMQRGAHEVDDGFALLQAFHSPELRIRGVSIVLAMRRLQRHYQSARRLSGDSVPSV